MIVKAFKLGSSLAPVLEALVQTHGILAHPRMELQVARCQAQVVELWRATKVEGRLQRG